MRETESAAGDALAILGDERFRVLEAQPGSRGLAWLRSTVCRFVEGAPHARRLSLLEAELARLDPAVLRARARARAAARPDDAARAVPMAVLAEALGVPGDRLDATVADAIVVGPAYVPGATNDEIDAAVERLRATFDRGDDERTAAAIAVLAQACEATALLIERAHARAGAPPHDVQALLEDTLRDDPPAPALRRIGPDGAYVLVDIKAAQAPFSAGRRPCPASRESLALAAGVLEALLG